MPPLTDAVRLIHYQPRRRIPQEKFRKEVGLKPLRRHVQQLDFPARRPFGRQPLLPERNRAVDVCGGNPLLAERVDLVLHQRDQRRNHDSVTGLHQNRKLIAERLSGTGRHDHAEIASGKDGFHDLLLKIQKPVKSEKVPERLRHGVHLSHRGIFILQRFRVSGL